ncbi:hypothetical protein [Gillisia sp. CAL575]|uniref:hypothetical protein n=1 Tax=Gillisia sp. CAL575 TaxID=985255 RepID=UPI00055249E4|nr:hypothetical protein [Gillisia sp. CAL575]
MKSIKALSMMIILLVGPMAFAQSHNITAGSACKYAKNRCTNMEGCPQCATCTTEDKKEKEAKVAEVQKRNEKIWAEAAAKKEAEQKAYEAKLASEATENKRKEEQALADKKASDELRDKYQDIANKGIVKSDIKGSRSTLELKNIEGFEDSNRKVYGFKLEGKEVAVFPFIEDFNSIVKILNTNFFEVKVLKKEGNYNNSVYKYSIIIDHLGNKVEIDGNNKFVRILQNDIKNSVIHAYTSNSSSKYIGDIISLSANFYDFYNNNEAAIAYIKKPRYSGGIRTKCSIQNVNRYTLNYDLQKLNKETGWIIIPD